MQRLSFALCTLFLSVVSAAACSQQEKQQLLTSTLHNEAEPDRSAQAAVMAVIANRITMPQWPNSLCDVLKDSGQFQEQPKQRDPEKWASAEEAARIFLSEMPNFKTEAAIFARLKGYDSFHTTKGAAKEPGDIVIGGNSFYKSSSNE